MSFKMPEFHIARVFDDGTQEPAEIVPVLSMPWDTRTGRRGFLGTGLAAGIVFGVAGFPRLADGRASRRSDDKDHCAEVAIAHTDTVSCLAFSPDGRWLAGGAWKHVAVWAMPSGRRAATLGGHEGQVVALAFSPDSRWIASSGHDCMVRLWHLPEGELRGCLFDAAALEKGHRARYISREADAGSGLDVIACESPVPVGATCTCNCVGGTSRGWRGGMNSSCSCNKVCTCVPVHSSRRWKSGIRPLDRALAKVQRLRGVRFEWTADAPDGLGGPDLGVIAEEVADVVPELVARDESGAPVAVDYARMTVLLIEAVKAQQRQITALRRRIKRMSRPEAA